MQHFFSAILELWRSLLGAVLFYTMLPIPHRWQPSFSRIARWCPWLGILLGCILAALFWGLTALNSPILLKSVVVVAAWLGLTGGLHLDGAMDTADGLAVTNPERRLKVMADSVTGAFGVMTAIVILLFKVAGISALGLAQWWLLPLTLAWGRWSQVMAIAFFPYLKPEGKGAFHKQEFCFYPDLAWSLVPVLALTLARIFLSTDPWQTQLLFLGLGLLTAIGISKWFQDRLQGHTGDTYGATVEWTEAILLNAAILLLNWLEACHL